MSGCALSQANAGQASRIILPNSPMGVKIPVKGAPNRRPGRAGASIAMPMPVEQGTDWRHSMHKPLLYQVRHTCIKEIFSLELVLPGSLSLSCAGTGHI